MVIILLKMYCIYKERNSGFSNTSMCGHIREREIERERSQERRKRERKNKVKKRNILKDRQA